MSKALEAARRAIESHPAYDCGSTGGEEMAQAAISAYLSSLAEDEEIQATIKAAVLKERDDMIAIYGRDAAMFDLGAAYARAALRALVGEK